MRRLTLLLGFLLLSCTAGVPRFEPFCSLDGEPTVGRTDAFIVGGGPSTEPESIVKVYMDGSYCSGTVIGSHTVLFAAHCLEDGPAVKVCQGFGNPCLEVEWSRQHPDYDRLSHFFADVAVLKTVQPLAYEPIELAHEGLQCYNVMKSKGYGRTDNELRGLNEVGVVELVRDDFIVEVTRGACYGDSGSALLVYDAEGTPYILGVSSHLHGSGGSCSEVASAGYALVFEFADWILEQKGISENGTGTTSNGQAGSGGQG